MMQLVLDYDYLTQPRNMLNGHYVAITNLKSFLEVPHEGSPAKECLSTAKMRDDLTQGFHYALTCMITYRFSKFESPTSYNVPLRSLHRQSCTAKNC